MFYVIAKGRNLCTNRKEQGFPRYRFFWSGRDPVIPSHPGIARDGIGRGTVSTVRYRTALGHHGIERGSLDGIDISRDCTGRDLRDASTALHGRGFCGRRWFNLNHVAPRHAIAGSCPGTAHDVLPLSCQDRGCSLCT